MLKMQTSSLTDMVNGTDHFWKIHSIPDINHVTVKAHTLRCLFLGFLNGTDMDLDAVNYNPLVKGLSFWSGFNYMST
jgi:hypothetical protein